MRWHTTEVSPCCIKVIPCRVMPPRFLFYHNARDGHQADMVVAVVVVVGVVIGVGVVGVVPMVLLPLGRYGSCNISLISAHRAICIEL